VPRQNATPHAINIPPATTTPVDSPRKKGAPTCCGSWDGDLCCGDHGVVSLERRWRYLWRLSRIYRKRVKFCGFEYLGPLASLGLESARAGSSDPLIAL
jgi:hypothetical protein